MRPLSLFKSQTDYDSDSNAAAVVRGMLARNRGANLEVIDAAMQAWEVAVANNDATGIDKSLEHVIVACAWWLKLKQSKIGAKTQLTNTDTRALAIRDLKMEATLELTNYSAARTVFATNKANAVDRGIVVLKLVKGSLKKSSEIPEMVELSQGYGHERTSYIDSKKDKAISASAIYTRDGVGHDISYKEYLRTYKDIVREGASGDVHVTYLPKSDRLQFLLVCQNGIFSYAGGGYPHSSTRVGDMEPYAIDIYGNFYSTKLGTKTPLGQIFNHSCFTAGTPVMCAGSITFTGNGVLRHIDNCSGHYKPDRVALWKAVNLLISQGVNGAELRVAVEQRNPLPMQYFKGTTFARNRNAAPDWDPADDVRLGI